MNEKIQPLEWQNLWDAMKSNPAEWIPTTEKMYWEMLEVLPPRAHIGASFLVGEPLHDDDQGQAVYSCFNNSFGKYSAKNLTVKEFLKTFARTISDVERNL